MRSTHSHRAARSFLGSVVGLGTMALVHLHFVHHFVVSLWSAFYERPVLLRRELRQLAQECDDAPKKFIIVRHSPKFPRRCEATAATEFGRSRIKSLADLRPLHPRSEMAAAAHLRVFASPCGDALRVSQIGGDDCACRANSDRTFPHRRHQPKNRLGVPDVCGDIVEAPIDSERGCTDSG